MSYGFPSLEVSNREDWSDTIEIRDEDGALVNLTGASIILEVRRAQRPNDAPVLSATTANGKVTITGLGLARFSFTRAEMTALSPASYDLGATIERDGVTDQIIISSVLVLDGIVRK